MDSECTASRSQRMKGAREAHEHKRQKMVEQRERMRPEFTHHIVTGGWYRISQPPAAGV